MKRLLAGASMACLAWYGGDARAEDVPRAISIRAPSCAELPWSQEQWRDALRVELAADAIRIVPSSETHLEVALEPSTCSSSASAAVLTLSSGGAARTRTVALSDVDPIARPRLLAIAMAELIRAGLPPPSAPPPSAPALPEPSPSAPRPKTSIDPPAVSPRESARARAPEELSPSASGLFAMAETRAFPQGSAALFGGRAGARLPLVGWAALELDAGALFGGAHDPLGDIDGDLASFGVSLLGVGGARSLSFALGPRVEAGIAWFRGHPFAPTTAASSVTSPIALFSLTACASFRVVGALSGRVAVDAGTSLFGFGARADDRHAMELRGPLLSTRIGLAWALE